MIRFRELKGRIALFAGTSEGRELAERFRMHCSGQPQTKMQAASACAEEASGQTESDMDIYVTTDYGASLLPKAPRLRVHVGCFLREDMLRSFREAPPVLVIDATHPYASHISETLTAVCAELGLRYVRIRRPSLSGEMSSAEKPGVGFCVRYFDDISAAAAYLEAHEGNVLITTGAKELAEYAAVPDFSRRCFLRALPTEAVLRKAKELGLPADRLCLMQGPFSAEMNLALLRHCRAEFLVTKASGARGGFAEKWSAAERAGISLLVVGRPTEPALPPGGRMAEVEDFV